MTYSPRPEASGDTLNSSRDQIRTNFQIAQTRFAQDHIDFNAASNAGLHQWCRFPEVDEANLPAVVANISTLYAKLNDYSNLYVRSEGGAKYQLTALSATVDAKINSFGANAYDPAVVNVSGGWTFLPGGLIMMYGRADTAKGFTIPWALPFPSTNAPYHVSITLENGAATVKSATITTYDKDGFTFVAEEPYTAVHFIAIGK